MSRESKALLMELHSIIREQASEMTDFFLSQQDPRNPLLHPNEIDIKELRKLSLTSRQKVILRQCMLALGRQIVFSTLSLIDGVSDVDTVIPDLSLVNHETKKEITDQFLHDEFIDLLDE